MKHCTLIVQNLESLFDSHRVRIPQDLLGGKDRIVFGNIRDIYDFHKK